MKIGFSVNIYRLARMGPNIDDYLGFQPKITFMYYSVSTWLYLCTSLNKFPFYCSHYLLLNICQSGCQTNNAQMDRSASCLPNNSTGSFGTSCPRFHPSINKTKWWIGQFSCTLWISGGFIWGKPPNHMARVHLLLKPIAHWFPDRYWICRTTWKQSHYWSPDFFLLFNFYLNIGFGIHICDFFFLWI